MIKSKGILDKTTDVIIYAILGLLTLSTLIPLLNVLAVSLSDSTKASSGLVTIFPLGFNLEPYKMVMNDKALLNAALVSVKRVVYSIFLVLFLTVLASYPLSKDKKEFPLRDVYMWIVLITMMFPPNTIPLYFTVRDLKMVGSIWALVLPGAVGQFYIILMINYFRNIPKELEESAKLDGANPWRVLFQIYIPLSKPIIATILLFIIVFNWNSYFDGLIYATRTEDYPLQTYVQQLVVNINPNITDLQALKRMLAVSNRGLNAAKIVVTMLPIIIVYPGLQRYFISGIMLGSVKE